MRGLLGIERLWFYLAVQVAEPVDRGFGGRNFKWIDYRIAALHQGPRADTMRVVPVQWAQREILAVQ
jgi:hypothetical protein